MTGFANSGLMISALKTTERCRPIAALTLREIAIGRRAICRHHSGIFTPEEAEAHTTPSRRLWIPTCLAIRVNTEEGAPGVPQKHSLGDRTGVIPRGAATVALAQRMVWKRPPSSPVRVGAHSQPDLRVRMSAEFAPEIVAVG